MKVYKLGYNYLHDFYYEKENNVFTYNFYGEKHLHMPVLPDLVGCHLDVCCKMKTWNNFRDLE